MRLRSMGVTSTGSWGRIFRKGTDLEGSRPQVWLITCSRDYSCEWMIEEFIVVSWAGAGSQEATCWDVGEVWCAIGWNSSTSGHCLGSLWAIAGKHNAGEPPGAIRQAGSCPLGCGMPELVHKTPAAGLPEKLAERWAPLDLPHTAGSHVVRGRKSTALPWPSSACVNST